LDNVAPPITEHEVVEIWISHDIAGYVGLEPLVFQSFSKMMEQTDGGDVVIRKGRSTGQRDGEYGSWDMNFCDDIIQATKLCKVSELVRFFGYIICGSILNAFFPRSPRQILST
jgi:hypothetical protein